MKVHIGKTSLRILDLDSECRPLAWYGGDFVTKQPTAIAWKFIGERGGVQIGAIGESGDPDCLAAEEEEMLEYFRLDYNAADIVTGHYIRGFDLPVLNGAMLRLGLTPLEDKLASDTKLDFSKAQGLSKSQENLGAMFELKHPKVNMNCYTPKTRFLTEDLRWVPCGDLVEGDRLWGFTKERKWASTAVTYSAPAVKECVEIYLDTGETLTCTEDHPWLARTRGDGHFVWTTPNDLLNRSVLHRPVLPFERDNSADGGWLAGMLDGEGSIGRASRVSVSQCVGETADRLLTVASRYGDWWVQTKQPTPGNLPPGTYRDQIQMVLRGGVSANISLLGRVRSERLIKTFDMSGTQLRSAHSARVVGVRKVGRREIQSISTDVHTYIAEGFAVHNTTLWAEGNMLTTKGIEQTKKRCVGDVAQHIEMRAIMIDRGLLRPPSVWTAEGSGKGFYHA